MNERDTYKYRMIKGRRFVHRGITKDLDAAERHWQSTWPSACIKQVGVKTTYQEALDWERLARGSELDIILAKSFLLRGAAWRALAKL